jgi:hypothetical protein
MIKISKLQKNSYIYKYPSFNSSRYAVIVYLMQELNDKGCVREEENEQRRE